MTGLQEAASRPTENSVFSSHENVGRNSGSADAAFGVKIAVWQ
jgi:hypothetical protein